MNNQVDQLDPRLIQTRQVLLQSVIEKYQALVEVINKIPMQQDIKAEAIRNINSGYLWAKEGISSVTFNFEKKEDSIPEPVINNDASQEEKAKPLN